MLRYFSQQLPPGQPQLVTFLTSSFSHAGLAHLAINMFALHGFGSAVAEVRWVTASWDVLHGTSVVDACIQRRLLCMPYYQLRLIASLLCVRGCRTAGCMKCNQVGKGVFADMLSSLAAAVATAMQMPTSCDIQRAGAGSLSACAPP